jgi:hypothetical protein
MPGVAGILLQEVAQQAAQVGVTAVRPGGMDQLVEPADAKCGIEAHSGAGDGAVPQCPELLWAVMTSRRELPLVSLPSQPMASQGEPIGSPASLVANT